MSTLATAHPTKQSTENNLRDFTLTFFATFGATSKRLDRRKQGAVLVELPEPMAAHFGKPALHLVFQNAEMTSDTDLVAYGSRVFDQIMAYLDRQGALTVLELPVRYQGADDLLRAVQPRNASVVGLQLAEQKRQIFIFNWHVTYRADDKNEELISVVVDDQGNRISQVETAEEMESGNGVLHLPTLFADARPAPAESDEAGQPLPPRLPPMTQLTRLAESARKYALYQADVRCVSYEAEILPRLHKVLARLTNYYQQQIEEVYDAHDPNGEKRQLLDDDLQRKIAEEVENHRLRVQVRLFSYAMIHVPVAIAQIRVGDGRREIAIEVARNRYTGALRRPTCYSCQQSIETLVLCRNGHASCTTCNVQCGSCHETLCQSCGLHTCPDCGRQNCETCSRFCWACGERACVEHTSRCPVCGDETCHACQTTCAVCGERQCRSHLYADGVNGALTCARCAVRCPGCSSFSSQLETCAVSGQRFCANCIVRCTACQKPLGPTFYFTDPVDDCPYCPDCLQPCPTCGVQSGVIVEPGCTACGRALCGHCATACTTCGDLLCTEHQAGCCQCEQPLCQEDQIHCQIGDEILCATCARACAGCGQIYCNTHGADCEICLQSYCEECIRLSGLCDTCAVLTRQGGEVAMIDEPIIEDPRIGNIWDRHTWIGLGNERYKVYLGVDPWMRHVLVVAEGANVLHIRRGKVLAKLFEVK